MLGPYPSSSPPPLVPFPPEAASQHIKVGGGGRPFLELGYAAPEYAAKAVAVYDDAPSCEDTYSSTPPSSLRREILVVSARRSVAPSGDPRREILVAPSGDPHVHVPDQLHKNFLVGLQPVVCDAHSSFPAGAGAEAYRYGSAALRRSFSPGEKADRYIMPSDGFPLRIANREALLVRNEDGLPMHSGRIDLAPELRAGLQPFGLFFFRDFLVGDCLVALQSQIPFIDGPGGPLVALEVLRRVSLGSGRIRMC